MRFRPLIAPLLLVLIVAGCSSSDSSEPAASPNTGSTSTSEPTPTTQEEEPTSEPTEEPTTAPTVTPTSTPEATAEPEDESIETVIASRIRAFFDAREAANQGPAPDPTDPALPEVASGEALASAIAETQRRLDDGRAIRPGEQGLAEIRVGTVQVDGATAQAAVCSIDDGVIYTVASGDVVNDDVVTHNYLVDLQQVDGIWRVDRIVRLQQWEGVAGCALAPGDFPY